MSNLSVSNYLMNTFNNAGNVNMRNKNIETTVTDNKIKRKKKI